MVTGLFFCLPYLLLSQQTNIVMRKLLLTLMLGGFFSLNLHASSFYEEKKDTDDKFGKRTIRQDPVSIELVDNCLLLHFSCSLGNISIQLIDDKGDILYNDSIVVFSSDDYCIPLEESVEKMSLIIDGKDLHIECMI